jgi:hypothetical protein
MTDLDEILAYPLLTQDSDGSTSNGAGGRHDGMGGDNARIVSSAIRRILGWQPRKTDARGFVAALNQSFKIEKIDGYSQVEWTPRAYSIDAGMGEVTGAQANLYQQGQVVMREVGPLLDGLKPLLNDLDKEDLHATLAIIRSALNELTIELGAVGGPRAEKVDQSFRTLLGRMTSGSSLRATMLPVSLAYYATGWVWTLRELTRSKKNKF